VEIAAIKKARHELVQGILREIKMLSIGSAIEVPPADVGGIGLANLRSAVHRVCIAEGWTIETVAGENNLYVWKTEKPEA
jgi:hypothetical protein